MQQAWRASLLRFDTDGQAVFDEDGLLVTAADDQGVHRVLAAGAHRALAPQYPDAPVTHLPGRILAPGFIDTHVHYPQLDVIGSPADGLLPWLDLESNVAAHVIQEKGDYHQARQKAEVVIKRRFVYDRGTAAAMENRGIVAQWDGRSQRLTMWDTTQAPIPIRNGLAAMLA